MTEPIFIVGASRSGTTLMRLALNAHPSIAIPEESDFLPRVVANQKTAWQEFVDDFVASSDAYLWPPVDLSDLASGLKVRSDRDPALLFSAALSKWACEQGKNRWGEKSPDHIFYADVIMKLFPHAKIIELIRDPRSVVASLQRFWGAAPVRVPFHAQYWHDVITQGHSLLVRDVPTEQRMSIRYEDLVAEPEGTLRQVCTFLGEDFTGSMLTSHENAADVLKPGYFSGQSKVLGPIGADVFAWRERLTDSQLAMIEHLCGPEMAAWGYECEGRRLRFRELAELFIMSLYIRLKQLQHRSERYHRVTYPPFGVRGAGSYAALLKVRAGTARVMRRRGGTLARTDAG